MMNCANSLIPRAREVSMGFGTSLIISLIAGTAPAAMAQQAPAPPTSKSYTVQPGNTLEDFSDQLFDDKHYWRGILGKNPKIKNPNLIYPGQKIVPHDPGEQAAGGGLRKWRKPAPADHTPLLLRMELELMGEDSSQDSGGSLVGIRPASRQPLPTSSKRRVKRRIREYPQFWLFPAKVRVIATLGPKDDSELVLVNRDRLKLKRSGEISAKTFCLIRPLAQDSEADVRLYRIIARYFPLEAPLAQPFKLVGRHTEAKVGDQLAAQCPPSLARIRQDNDFDQGGNWLAIPREEVTVFHPEMRQFILPGRDAVWRLASGGLPESIRFLKLYRTDSDQETKIEIARAEILQRQGRSLIVRYLSLANTSY